MVFLFISLVMRKVFQMFDQGKTGFIDSSKVATILNTLGHNFDDEELQALVEGHDPESMLN